MVPRPWPVCTTPRMGGGVPVSGRVRHPLVPVADEPGRLIDRARPLSFRLDGRVIPAFSGDTVVTALLRAGVTAAGTHLDQAVALLPQFAPLVMHRDGRDAPLPAARLPVVPGLDLLSLEGFETVYRPRRWPLSWVVPPAGDSLGHALSAESGAMPFAHEPARAEFRADLVVIGAGLAGLMAAREAVEAGRSVILLEQRPAPGGIADFFPADPGGPAPESLVASALARLGGRSRARLILNAEALAIEPGGVRFHQVLVEDRRPVGRVAFVRAGAVIVATGASERIGVFAGNRLPGVLGATVAHRMRRDYGIWFGNRLVISTSSSLGYRVGLTLCAQGAEVLRIVDTRREPDSRDRDRAMAEGLTLGTGTVPSPVLPGRGAHRLEVGFDVSFEGGAPSPTRLEVDQVLVAGSFQPEIALLAQAGVPVRWDTRHELLVAAATLPEVSLAGSAAGLMSHGAVAASGQAVAAALFGREALPVVDPAPEASAASAPGPAGIAPSAPAGSPPAYLDQGPGLVTRAMVLAAQDTETLLVERPQALSLDAVAALVGLGALPASTAALVARGRVTSPAPVRTGQWRARAGSTPLSPGFLDGRFGPTPIRVRLVLGDGRRPEIGALVYGGPDERDPRRAVGVIESWPQGGLPGGIATLAHLPKRADGLVFVREEPDLALAAEIAKKR